MNKEFYTPAEVAEICRVKRLAVYRWIKAGKIDSVKIGRGRLIPAAEVERLKAGKPAPVLPADPIGNQDASADEIEAARRALEYAARFSPELTPEIRAAILEKLKG